MFISPLIYSTECPPGYFGIGCLYKCDTHCSGKGACNPVNGVCDQGCKAGWTGSKCGTGEIT